MDAKQLNAWLVDLAGGFNFELKPALVKAYLKILSVWNLTPAQWDELSSRALLRYEFFPRISQLYDLASEILQESEIRANTDNARAIWARGSSHEQQSQG